MSPRDVIEAHDNPRPWRQLPRTLTAPCTHSSSPTLRVNQKLCPASGRDYSSRRQRWAACAGDGCSALVRRQSPPLPESRCFPSVALTPSQPASDPPARSPSRRVKQLYDSLPLVSPGHGKSHPGTTAYGGGRGCLWGNPMTPNLLHIPEKLYN